MATVAALVWANLPGDTYEEFWHVHVSADALADLAARRRTVAWLERAVRRARG